MRYELVTAQTSWSVALADVKNHLRVDSSDDDDYIQDLIYACEAMIYEDYDLSLNEEVWKFYLDEFPDEDTIKISKWPIASIDSVKYLDNDGDEQTMSSDDYNTSVTGRPTIVRLDDGSSWPDTGNYPDAVRVQFTTGFSSPEVIPYDIKQAMYLIIADWYDNRQDNLRRFPQASRRILAKYGI